MKTIWTAMLVTMACFLAACQTLSRPNSILVATDEGEANATPAIVTLPPPVLKTDVGELAIVSSRLVSEVKDAKANAGEGILLLTLARPGPVELDPHEFSLEAFQTMVSAEGQGRIYIEGSDGMQATSAMAGWVQDEFTMGFRVPLGTEPYTLHWPGNSPIELSPEK